MSTYSKELYPLTHEQISLLEYDARTWSCSNYKPLNSFALRITGNLDAEGLLRNFAEIIGRHRALRTQILSVDGVLWQTVSDHSEFNLEPTDFTNRDDIGM